MTQYVPHRGSNTSLGSGKQAYSNTININIITRP